MVHNKWYIFVANDEKEWEAKQTLQLGEMVEPSLVFRIPRERRKYSTHTTHHTQDFVFL
jgi:hypothetical protein